MPPPVTGTGLRPVSNVPNDNRFSLASIVDPGGTRRGCSMGGVDFFGGTLELKCHSSRSRAKS